MRSADGTPVEYEEVRVTNPNTNRHNLESPYSKDGELQPKNVSNVFNSSKQLEKQTTDAIKDGFFPIVLGGDHSQAIGSVGAFKKLYGSQGKILWIDAHYDVNTPVTSPSGNAHGMPLAYLSGYVPGHENMKCMDMAKDICYFGVRSFEEGEEHVIVNNQVLSFDSSECKAARIEKILNQVQDHFNHDANTKYWISFDIDGLDPTEFYSTGTAEANGLSLEFVYTLLEKMIPMAVGMDIVEINFELTKGEVREKDEATVKELFNFINDKVNQPADFTAESTGSENGPELIPSIMKHCSVDIVDSIFYKDYTTLV